ncbi:hypothetical protein [Hydrogenibacillus sp. N12]|uniref:hypothetical protein n=1 Tax=Hydrogenibacillus sp. N12 TaxID=2866627 RepID=UPI001C7CEC9A|nr:hypothetical protein [Hydrogenibacillus sp. N12]QZA33921.1 hypothetical protein K2M58_05305 [Hydrogenibacillus sp. N12]
MPANPLGALIRWLFPFGRPAGQNPPAPPGRTGGFPGVGVPYASRPTVPAMRPLPPAPRPTGMPFGAPPATPAPPGASGGGLFNWAELLGALRNVDPKDIAATVTTVRQAMQNIQKIAQTVNQFASVAANVQQLLKTIDVETLLGLLGGFGGDGASSDGGSASGSGDSGGTDRKSGIGSKKSAEKKKRRPSGASRRSSGGRKKKRPSAR